MNDSLPKNGAQIEVEQPVRVDIVLWQDAMPGAASDSLAVLVTIHPAGEADLPMPIVYEVVLEHDSESWTGTLFEQTGESSSRRDYTTRDGPSWPAGSLVDATVNLRTHAGLRAVHFTDVLVRKVE